jgi:hypothetical protein
MYAVGARIQCPAGKSLVPAGNKAAVGTFYHGKVVGVVARSRVVNSITYSSTTTTAPAATSPAPRRPRAAGHGSRVAEPAQQHQQLEYWFHDDHEQQDKHLVYQHHDDHHEQQEQHLV